MSKKMKTESAEKQAVLDLLSQLTEQGKLQDSYGTWKLNNGASYGSGVHCVEYYFHGSELVRNEAECNRPSERFTQYMSFPDAIKHLKHNLV